jgi:hypothetical protein
VFVGVSDAFCASVGSFNSRSSKVMYETVMFQKGKMFSIDAGDFQVYYITNVEHLEVLFLELICQIGQKLTWEGDPHACAKDAAHIYIEKSSSMMQLWPLQTANSSL